jgi:hypothetical protein
LVSDLGRERRRRLRFSGTFRDPAESKEVFPPPELEESRVSYSCCNYRNWGMIKGKFTVTTAGGRIHIFKAVSR